MRVAEAPKQDQPPRWVATGPLLPAAMFVATLIAALNYPRSFLAWFAVALCALGTIVLVVRALRIRKK